MLLLLLLLLATPPLQRRNLMNYVGTLNKITFVRACTSCWDGAYGMLQCMLLRCYGECFMPKIPLTLLLDRRLLALFFQCLPVQQSQQIFAKIYSINNRLNCKENEHSYVLPRAGLPRAP